MATDNIKLDVMPLRFRVWDKEDKDWAKEEDDYALRLDGGLSHHNGVISYGWRDRFVISQDTGLKDKNGKNIYTGDIVKWENDCWEVGYDLCKGRLYLYCYQTQEHESVNDKKQPYWEIVGNIWQGGEK